MEDKDVQFKTTAARATFNVDYAICLNGVSEKIKLPGFQASEDDDLTWAIEIQQEKTRTWESSASYAPKLRVSISFESRSNKETVYASIDVTIRQTSDPEDIEETIKQVSESKLATVTQDDFMLNYNVCLSEYSKQGHTLGHMFFHNSVHNGLIIKASVEVTDLTLQAQCRKKVEEADSPFFAYDVDSSDYLVKLLRSGLYSDVTLKAEEQEIHVHRCILGVRSEVFKTMFEKEDSNMTSSSSRLIHITDISFPVLKKLLR